MQSPNDWTSSSVQSLSRVQLFATPWTAAHEASLSITNSWSLLKFMSIKSVMPSNHLILCHPLLLLPSIFPSITVLSNKLALRIRWPKYWSFSFSISWLVGSLCSPKDSQEFSPTPQFKSVNSLALSFLYDPTLISIHDYRKTIALTRWTFVGKVLSLLFYMLSRLVIASISRSKHLLISWLQSLSVVILEPRKMKSVTVSIVSPSICPEVMRPDAMILVL